MSLVINNVLGGRTIATTCSRYKRCHERSTDTAGSSTGQNQIVTKIAAVIWRTHIVSASQLACVLRIPDQRARRYNFVDVEFDFRHSASCKWPSSDSSLGQNIASSTLNEAASNIEQSATSRPTFEPVFWCSRCSETSTDRTSARMADSNVSKTVSPTVGELPPRLKRLYRLLLALRFLMAVLPLSHVHDAEFLHGQELMAQDVLGLQTKVPPELRWSSKQPPSQSVIFPYVLSIALLRAQQLIVINAMWFDRFLASGVAFHVASLLAWASTWIGFSGMCVSSWIMRGCNSMTASSFVRRSTRTTCIASHGICIWPQFQHAHKFIHLCGLQLVLLALVHVPAGRLTGMMIFLAPRLTMFAYSLVCGNEGSRCSHNVVAFLLLSAPDLFFMLRYFCRLCYTTNLSTLSISKQCAAVDVCKCLAGAGADGPAI